LRLSKNPKKRKQSLKKERQKKISARNANPAKRGGSLPRRKNRKKTG